MAHVSCHLIVFFSLVAATQGGNLSQAEVSLPMSGARASDSAIPTRPALAATTFAEGGANSFDWCEEFPWWGWALLAGLLALSIVVVCEACAMTWRQSHPPMTDIEACSQPEDGHVEVPLVQAELPALLLSHAPSVPIAAKPKLGYAGEALG
mmetsp:Transcript_6748/g.18604  ORF Transcript_6748/g.18604 Transcript_6748/m.18604 type:complete len:152 (-) Transcript_6748:386-841(-)